MNFPENLRYTKDHEWVKIDGNIGTVGITEYAQGELGDVVFVELPAVGKTVKIGDSFGTVEAVKAVSDIYSPASGSVTEINKEIQNTPELVNKEPYNGGWMLKMALSNPAEISDLLDAAAYKKLIGK